MRKSLPFLGVLTAILAFSPLRAQSPQSTMVPEAPQWQIDAGGKAQFDVASVKLNTSGVFPPSPSNFALDSGDGYPGNTTLFSAPSFPMTTFVVFAYKLPLAQWQVVESQLPKWATTEKFDIQARAANPSTKDQMRLMMQSLLAERFKLKVHFETHDKPIFNLVLARPGKTGPQLRPYAHDPPCTDTTSMYSSPSGTAGPDNKAKVGEFPPACRDTAAFVHSENGSRLLTWGGRNLTMHQIAELMKAAPLANVDRPVVDQTGLTGDFDFLITYGISVSNPLTPGTTDPEDNGPTFRDALKDQLGLKLESGTGPVESLILDHIEEPTPN